MGNWKSKHKGPPGKSKNSSPSNFGKEQREFDASVDNVEWSEISQRWMDDTQLKIIRRTIDKDPEMFVLNNLMMCVQFFQNFDEEMKDMRENLVSSRETELNSCVPAHKRILVPDLLQQHVAERIDFTCTLPSLKHTTELVQPIRIYVIFDNIEVTEENYASPYCSVEQTITYNMQLKPSQDHKGYVKLERLEVNPPKKVASADDLSRMASYPESTREIYSDGDSIYGGKLRKNVVVAAAAAAPVVNRMKNVRNFKNSESPAGSTSSGYRSANHDTESDYGYAESSTYNDVEEMRERSERSFDPSSSEIPRECFKKMEFRADGKIYDARKERRQKMSVKEQLVWQAHRRSNYSVWYLNSKRFMKYFCQLFSSQLAIPMGFDPDVSESTHGSVIYRDKVELLEGPSMSTKLETFEIVPCVRCQWPECAREWLDRPRTSWPDYGLVDKVREFGSHIVPEVSISDKPGAYQDLEWQLVFPAAERYLETCLTYPQVRVYLTALMLHKSFIRPVDSIFGLTTAHIKSRLFWLVEEDDRPLKWMENRTGEALVRFLDSLYKSISQDEPSLPDYFIREKNLFREKACLLRTQKQLKRIIENPVMYVFHALENVRHTRAFFPRLDYEQLLKILTADVLTLVNPALIVRTIQKPLASTSSSDRPDYEHPRSFWDDVKRKTDDKTKSSPRKPIRGNLINPRRAYDQVVEIPIRCASMESRRLYALLDFFIKHFIKMADYCRKYGATSQKMAYIEQAERLSILLLEDSFNRDEAKDYLKKISNLRRQNSDSKLAKKPPETPKRNPDMPVFTRPLNDRFRAPEHEQEIPNVILVNGSGAKTTKVLVHEQLPSIVDEEKNSLSTSTEIPTDEQIYTSEKLVINENKTRGSKRNALDDVPSEEIQDFQDCEATYI